MDFGIFSNGFRRHGIAGDSYDEDIREIVLAEQLGFRDAYISDLERSDKSRNRLSALYVDYKSLTGGYGVRLGRQSPTGGGVMGRFDGVSANLLLRPKLKLSAVAGECMKKWQPQCCALRGRGG